MRVEELDYHLPEERIAQWPPADRDGSRLMVLPLGGGGPVHARFVELPRVLGRPSLLVMNDSRVIPARLRGRRASGGAAELLLVRRLASEGADELWLCLGRPAKRLRPGAALDLGPISGTVEATVEEGLEVRLRGAPTVSAALEGCGLVPLPPYIRREPEPADRERYQTVYASRDGSVAAPTAGLHFSERVLADLEAAGHRTARVTLHVGPGTFLPVRTPDLASHRMHGELLEVGQDAVDAIEAARAEGRPVVAVGTTVVRALEAAALGEHGLRPMRGMTDLLIVPGHRFRVVDGLVTNFHLPRSTLLALVCALAGRERVLEAYREAVREGYRFYSYGDAMLLRVR